MEVDEDVTLALGFPFLGVAPVLMFVDWFLPCGFLHLVLYDGTMQKIWHLLLCFGRSK